MNFLDFLKDKGVVDAKAVNMIRDSAAMAKRSIFQELYTECDKSTYCIIYRKLEEYIIASCKLSGYEVTPLRSTAGCNCDEEIYDRLGGITPELATYFIPIKINQTNTRYALTSRPDDEDFIEKLNAAYGNKQFSVAVCADDIWKAIYEICVEPVLLGKSATKVGSNHIGKSKVSDTVKESDVRKFYTRLLNVGVARHASDVHFIPCSEDCRVVFRIDGVNHQYTRIPLDVLERIVNILKADGAITEPKPNMPLDGKVRYSPSQETVPDDYLDLRVSIIRTKNGPDLNIRYLSSQLFTFEQLGLSEKNIASYKELLELPGGLVLQVGPTGSGKSTTLYAGLAYIHESLRNIITVEDPVEIFMDGISQIDVSESDKSKLGFADALKACLRHDPDVVVVGELRDEDTAFEAVRAANTGHLVLTSLHTNDSIGAFERLVNLGIDSYALGEVVAGVMGQRLIRRLCPHCKQAYDLHLQSPTGKFYRLADENRKHTFYKAVGCAKCNNTGYSGRIALNEILVIDSKLRDLIQKHAPRRDIEEYLRGIDFKTIYYDGIDKAMMGITSLEEMTKFAKDNLAFKG